MGTIIQASLYETYLTSLLNGERRECQKIVTSLIENKIQIRELYTDLFQKSLYRVGELWETNEISVAREHLATAITENMLSVSYPHLFSGVRSEKKAIISCTANEYHQIGGKMVADIFELQGWDTHFLGANTPVKDLIAMIDETKPDAIGLSLAIYFNLPALQATIEMIRSHFGNLDILVGGHAFVWGGAGILKNQASIHYFESLTQLEKNL